MVTEWIDKTVRPPDRETDGREHQGCVLGWHVYQGCCVATCERVRDNPFFTHWMPVPEAPEGWKGKVERPAYAG